MTLPFGGDTVTVVNFTESATDDPWGGHVRNEAATVVKNCQFQPMSMQETVELTNQAVQLWHLIAPPVAAMLAAKMDSQIRHNGDTYEIWGGIQPVKDADGAVFYVEAVCRRQQRDIT